MSNFDNNRKRKEEEEKWNNTVKEILSKYFLDISKLVFAAIVLGGLTPILSSESRANWIIICCGTFVTLCFALIGYRILKR